MKKKRTGWCTTTRRYWRRRVKGIAIKTLTPQRLLTRLPILLTQIKAVNNSYKLKTETRQILSFMST